VSGRDPSNEEVRAWARWLAARPENAGKNWEELIDSAYQLIVDMNRRIEDTRRRRYYERTGYITEAEAARIVTGDDDPDDALRRLSKLIDFLRASPDELCDEVRPYWERWMAQEELQALLRLHAPGQWSVAFAVYLRDRVFPEWKPFERKKVRKT
jgi:hypothetical protein